MEAFLVKVWKAGADEPCDGLRGTVVHLASGRLLAFAEPVSLLEFLSEAPGPTLTDPVVEREPS